PDFVLREINCSMIRLRSGPRNRRFLSTTPTATVAAAASWVDTRVSRDSTHHVNARSQQPLYSHRFGWVLPFHAPGLSPVGEARHPFSSYHVTVDGQPAYHHRFRRVFGFYESLAAVQSS